MTEEDMLFSRWIIVDCMVPIALKTFKLKTWQYKRGLFETSTQKRKLKITFRGKLLTADMNVEQSRFAINTDVEDDFEIFGIDLKLFYNIWSMFTFGNCYVSTSF